MSGSLRCAIFGHKYPWSAHETKSEENKAAQYSCQRCSAIVTLDRENALFTHPDWDVDDE